MSQTVTVLTETWEIFFNKHPSTCYLFLGEFLESLNAVCVCVCMCVCICFFIIFGRQMVVLAVRESTVLHM